MAEPARPTPPAPEPAPAAPSPPSALTRRHLLGAAGASGLVLGAAGGALGYAAGSDASAATDGSAGSGGAGSVPLTSVGSDAVMFHGKHQAGITTAAQACGHLVAFDLRGGAGRKEAAALLRRWSTTAARLMAGSSTQGTVSGAGTGTGTGAGTATGRGAAGTGAGAGKGGATGTGRGRAGETDPGDGHDTGVALDAGPSSLTVTFGFGHSFFTRTGLEKQRPDALDPLPDFSSDHLDAARSGGDLWVQVGANDALVAFHALRALQKDAAGTARPRWQMNGFNRSPGATAHPVTTRNLMGQIDGTNNPKPTDTDFDQRVFVPEGGSPAWMAGGSYVVVRRIRMLLDDWERLAVEDQEKVIGRRKSSGAPLTGGGERTEMKLGATGADGEYVVPLNAHARITRPDQNGGAAMLRRPFSFHDGFDADGVPDAGLLFVCWQADPLRGFVPVQRKLDRGDALSAFIRHEASGLFAVPGGADEGGYVGQRLLEG